MNNHRDFRGFPQPPSQVIDRLGRPVEAGDVVHIIGKLDTLWQVHQVRPILDPSVPPGTMELQLVATFTPRLPRGVNCMDLLKVLSKEQTQQIQGVTRQQPPAGETEPGA